MPNILMAVEQQLGLKLVKTDDIHWTTAVQISELTARGRLTMKG
jgi:hypothetical protein